MTAVLIFSQNAMAFNCCKHLTSTTIDSLSTIQNLNKFSQEEPTSPCHSSNAEDHSETKPANGSTCDFYCCESSCLHCQVYGAHIYIELTPEGGNFERPAGKESRIFSELNYTFQNPKPIIPPPIS